MQRVVSRVGWPESPGLLPSSGRGSGFPPSPSAEIVGDVGHDDRRLGAFEADAANDEVHPRLLLREDVLDAGADRGFPGIGLGHALRHRLAGGLPAVDAAGLAAIGQEVLVSLGAIGRVGPDIGRGVARIDQPFA